MQHWNRYHYGNDPVGKMSLSGVAKRGTENEVGKGI